VDQIEQDFARFKQPAMALTGGIAAALVVATLPHVYLENIVGATGLAEIIPAAAPPLGNTARGLIAVVSGLISASALYLFLIHKMKLHEGGPDMSVAIRKNLTAESMDGEREGKSRFAVPKLNLSAKSLTRFLKKPKKSPGQVTELKDLPDVRPQDRHPDAPARQPIFASSDLGAPLAERIKRFDQPVAEPNIAEPAKNIAQPVDTPEPPASDHALQSPSEQPPAPVAAEPVPPQVDAGMSRADLSGLSLAQLADRLEAGIKRLEALHMGERVAPAPVSPASAPEAEHMASLSEAPAAPAPVAIPSLRSVDSTGAVSPESRQADMDAALKAALGTLEKMTIQR